MTHLGELETAVMEEIWRRGEATVRDVHEALPRERAYTTVMTVMTRLCDKGMLVRERRGRSDLYRPTSSREQWTEGRAREGVDALVQEFGDLALAHFTRQVAALDPERREALRRLAEDG
jgi:BlaI family transcriptional regulator, penicillinase repressor